MSKKTCRVHHWATPSVGDEALICEECGRELGLMGGITPNIRASITVGYERRCGSGAIDGFRSAFNAAYDDALRRCQGPALPRGGLGGPASSSGWGRPGL